MTDRVVRHERPDYIYVPKGLMASQWGKTGYRTEVAQYLTDAHLRDRRMMDNDSSRDALEYIWSLDDATILRVCGENSDDHAEVCRRLSPVNPLWVTLQAATVAYYRDLIDENELDRIVKD